MRFLLIPLLVPFTLLLPMSCTTVDQPSMLVSQPPITQALEPEQTPNLPAASEPITEAVEVEVIVENEPVDLWERMRKGFQLSHEIDRQRVLVELKWFVTHPEYVERVAKRAGPHLYHVISEIERRGLPLEFALLPVVESAYDPFAYSHGRAAGLWQFIPSTARLYGLKIDWWYDGRRDVRASTKAAIDYLDYLHDLFDGDWLLALAAYNAGQGNVQSSIRASKLPKNEVNFWSLKVFRETYTYVPRLLAICEIIANPDRYHIRLPAFENEPYWEVVDINHQLDLYKAAELAEITTEKLYTLNPGFNQWATHPDGPHELVIPVSHLTTFRQNLAALDVNNRLSWKRHRVRRGENLGSIAGKYRTTIDTIRTANNITGTMIRTGDSLLIPVASTHIDYKLTQRGRLASKQERLKASYGKDPIVYLVRAGDSFWEISRQFDVGVRELAKWNGMGTSSVLYPGTKLKIYKKQAITLAQNRHKANEQVRRVNYRVREGESLSLIAGKFNLTVQKIKSWNNALNLKKYIHPGDHLTLYVDVTQLIN
jgi:membrane-bound lytic murein transglycosylase D